MVSSMVSSSLGAVFAVGAMELLLCLAGTAKILVEAIEALGPETLVEGEPVGSALEGGGVEPAAAVLAVADPGNEGGLLQHLQMARDRGERDLERCGQLVDRALSLHEPQQNRPARRIGQGGEGEVE